MPYTYSWSNGVVFGPTPETTFTLDSLAPGIYTLTITNSSGCSAVQETTILPLTAPSARFTAKQVPPCDSLYTIAFTDISSNYPDSWSWSFPGGMPNSSSEPNPVVQYSAPGMYTAMLIAANSVGADTFELQVDVIDVGLPKADFVYVINQGGVVMFTNLTQDGSTYIWDFGDGATSTLVDPTHAYTQKGTYPVLLTASNPCGVDSFALEITIDSISSTNSEAWLDLFKLYPNPNPGSFTIEMVGAPTQELRFALYNALGQLVKTETLNFGAGKLKHVFDYRDLPPSVYFMEIRADLKVHVEPVIIGN